MTTEYADIERKALDTIDWTRRIADRHSRLIVGTLVVTFVASFFGIINPQIPEWWPLVVWGIVAAGVTAFIVSGAIYALIPDKQGILLVSLRGDEPGGQVWEIYEDTWEEMSVDGTLCEWPESPRRVYEVRSYDPVNNHAVANWREAEPASAILDKRTPADAMAQVAELREIYEPEAARARRLLRRVRGIVRRLDRERTEARARQLDETTGLESIDSPAISDILDEELPDDLHPEADGDDLKHSDQSTGPKTNGNENEAGVAMDEENPLEMDGQPDPEVVGL